VLNNNRKSAEGLEGSRFSDLVCRSFPGTASWEVTNGREEREEEADQAGKEGDPRPCAKNHCLPG